MKPVILVTALVLALAPLSGACGGSTVSDQANDISSSLGLTSEAPVGRPSPDVPGEYIASGELTNVNLDGRLLMLDVAGSDYTFEFDDGTAVEGQASDIQGLVGSTGASATIHYRQEGDRRRAVRIELED